MKNQSDSFRFYVGIDISKLTIDVTVLDSQAKKNGYISFSNDSEGFVKLEKWLHQHKHFSFGNALLCYEHTGVYTRSLEQFMKDRQANLWIESSLHIKKSLGLNRGKNDKIDSLRIAEYCYRFHDKAVLERFDGPDVQKLKDLLAARDRLMKSLKVVTIAVKELKKQDKEQACDVELLNRAAIDGIKQSIKNIEKAMDELIKQDTQIKKLYDLATSIPGVGMILAVKLIVYTKAFTLFENVRQLACYCGVAPFEYRSGTSVRGATGVSKFANMDLKSTLHLASISAIQNNIELRKYYERKVKEGKSKMSVINAVRNKLLYRVVAVVRRGTPYVTLVQG